MAGNAVAGGEGTCPLPEDPALAEAARAFRDSGQWVEIVDAQWCTVYMTDDLRLGAGFMVAREPVPLGLHFFGPDSLRVREQWRTGPIAVDSTRAFLTAFGSWVLEDTPGGRAALRDIVDPRLRDIVDELPSSSPESVITGEYAGYGVDSSRPPMNVTAVRLRDRDGRLAGTAVIQKPRIKMLVLAPLGAMGDLAHFERMQSVAIAGRRPAAMLFADLEGSTPLAKRLSTASYFSVGRRMARAADRCIIEAGGIAGRHVGDGVVAFFLAENFPSESDAASASIRAARELRNEMVDVAPQRSPTQGPHDAVRSALGRHFVRGAYLDRRPHRDHRPGRRGQRGSTHRSLRRRRSHACLEEPRRTAHTRSRTSTRADLDRITYTQLGDLVTATEKARRDAPSIVVCELWPDR